MVAIDRNVNVHGGHGTVFRGRGRGTYFKRGYGGNFRGQRGYFRRGRGGHFGRGHSSNYRRGKMVVESPRLKFDGTECLIKMKDGNENCKEVISQLINSAAAVFQPWHLKIQLKREEYEKKLSILKNIKLDNDSNLIITDVHNKFADKALRKPVYMKPHTLGERIIAAFGGTSFSLPTFTPIVGFISFESNDAVLAAQDKELKLDDITLSMRNPFYTSERSRDELHEESKSQKTAENEAKVNKSKKVEEEKEDTDDDDDDDQDEEVSDDDMEGIEIDDDEDEEEDIDEEVEEDDDDDEEDDDDDSDV